MLRWSLLFFLLILASCRESRIHDHPEWEQSFRSRGITDGCFILRDNNHESVHFYNRDRCLKRFSPASTFKIFNSLVALETGVAPDDQYMIKWDGIEREMTQWNRDLNLRDAFRESCLPCYQQIAKKIGLARMEHFLDTSNYGNRLIGGAIDSFWIDGSLKISADEQVGLIKRLYFSELPFSERSQRIVRSMMKQEEGPGYRLAWKTGWGRDSTGKDILWMVGFAEKIVRMKEHPNSKNLGNDRTYPHFFALNFSTADTTQNWGRIRIELLKELLGKLDLFPARPGNTGNKS